MAGLVRNKAKLAQDIALAIERLEEAPIALYRKVVWQIFLRILDQTPQFSGRAVANWRLGINAPDLSFDRDMGEEVELTKYGRAEKTGRQKGDKKWIQEAIEGARYTLRRVKRGDRVFISNATRGDVDGGASSTAYLTDLQDPGYWSSKLRAANQPYETAMESAVLIAEGFLSAGNTPMSNLTEGP